MAEIILMKSKKLLKSLLSLIITGAVLSGAIYILTTSEHAKAWFAENRQISFDASGMRTITAGEANFIASLEDIDEQSGEIQFTEANAIKDKLIPGDLIYYTFILTNIDVSQLNTEYTLYFVNPTVSADTEHLDEVLGQGNYNPLDYSDSASFLPNLKIQENSVKFAVVERADAGSDNGITYSLFNNGTGYFYREYSEDGHPVSNTEVTSFENALSDVDLITFNMTVSLDQASYPSDSEGIVDLLMVVPIWYYDTAVNQNNEMACTINIAGCNAYLTHVQ